MVKIAILKNEKRKKGLCTPFPFPVHAETSLHNVYVDINASNTA